MRITPGSIALLVVAVGASIVFRNAFVSAHRQLGWAFACAVVAALMLPFADWLDRYVPRWLALLAAMVSLGLVALAAWALVVVNVRDGVATLERAAPSAAAELEAKYEVAREFRLVERVDALIAQMRQPSGGEVVGRAVGTAGTYFVCGILTLFLLVYGPKMLRSGIAQVRDHHRRLRVERVVLRTLRNARVYTFATLLQAAVVTALVGLTTWWLDLPAPFLLGLIAGAIGTVPTLGIVVGGLPALLMAAGVGGAREGWVVAALLVVLQALEVKLVRPRVDHASGMHLGPALPAIVALVAYQLYGYGGAVFGVIGLVFLIAWLDSVGFDDSPADEPATDGGAAAS